MSVFDTRSPDLRGDAGMAWLVSAAARAHNPSDTTIAAYLLSLPNAHLVFRWWQIAIIHLRDVPGMAPAPKHYPGAEYELAIHVLDPLKWPQMEFVGMTLRVQFHGTNDEGCRGLLRKLTEEIVDGKLPPESSPHWTAAMRRLAAFAPQPGPPAVAIRA